MRAHHWPSSSPIGAPEAQLLLQLVGRSDSLTGWRHIRFLKYAHQCQAACTHSGEGRVTARTGPPPRARTLQRLDFLIGGFYGCENGSRCMLARLAELLVPDIGLIDGN